jgi:hypothetical protein
MQLISDCTRCTRVVVPASALALLRQADGGFQAVFECPVCASRQNVSVSRVVAPVLIARGASMTDHEHDPVSAAESLVAELCSLLADEAACGRILDEAP